MKNRCEDLGTFKVSASRDPARYSKLDKCDIFVEERRFQLSPYLNIEKELEYRREISGGIIKNLLWSRQFLHTGQLAFWDSLNRYLFGSKKTWLIEESPLTMKDQIKLSKLTNEVLNSFSQARLEEYQRTINLLFEMEEEFTKKRNEAFGKQLISLQEENPNKTIGTFRDSTQTSLHLELKRKGVNVKALSPKMRVRVKRPYVRSLADEILLKHMFKRDVSETEKLRYVPSALLVNYFLLQDKIGPGVVNEYSVFESKSRKLCESLGDKALEDLALHFKENLDPSKVAHQFREASILAGRYFKI